MREPLAETDENVRASTLTSWGTGCGGPGALGAWGPLCAEAGHQRGDGPGPDGAGGLANGPFSPEAGPPLEKETP